MKDLNDTDDNIYQSANWTRPAANPGGRPRYAQLGGVSFLKPQNNDYLDYTNSYLSTRAIDRRTIDAFPDMQHAESTIIPPQRQGRANSPLGTQSGAGETLAPLQDEGPAPAAGSVVMQKPKHRGSRRRSRSSSSTPRQIPAQAPAPALGVPALFPPAVQSWMGNYANAMGSMVTDVGAALREPGGKLSDKVADCVYKNNRPYYLGLTLLLILLAIVAIVAFTSWRSGRQ